VAVAVVRVVAGVLGAVAIVRVVAGILGAVVARIGVVVGVLHGNLLSLAGGRVEFFDLEHLVGGRVDVIDELLGFRAGVG